MADKNLYFIALVPDEGLRNEIHTLKLETANHYGSKAALKSPPHLTLHMPFLWRADREDTLAEVLHAFQSNFEAITLDLKDFGFFPPKVVFISVIENQYLRELQQELCNHIRRNLNLFNANYKNMGFHPHVTIAFRDLKKSRFPEIQDDFTQRNFSAQWKVQEFTLLKYDGKMWQEIKHFSLG